MTPRPKNRTTTGAASTRNERELFTGLQPTQLSFDRALIAPGSHNDAQCIRAALAESIRVCGKSRAQIADDMTYLVGRRITERMLNGYTAESQEDYLFPAELTRAFCIAAGDTRVLRCVAELQGLKVISEDEAELIELGRAFLQRTQAEETIAILEKRLHGRTR